jgi:transcriptional antiterminator RfaH
MPNLNAAWYAVRTKPNQEKLARLNYEQQGFRVYLPMIRKVVRHARRKEEVLRPVFPGYLFLHLAPAEQNWSVIASTRGAVAPVRFGDTHVPVPDWVIDQLKAREEGGALTPSALKRRILQPGTAVSVNLDSNIETQGVVFSWRGTDNVVVLLDLLSRKIKATVPHDQVNVL